jgi:hypothetical protein
MKKFLIFLLLVGTIEAQQYRGQQNTSFSAVSTAPTINLTASGVNWHNIIWTTSGTVSTCSVQVDSSADGVTWSAGGVITSQTCTSNGNSTYVNVVASYIRVNLTVLTGGGSVNVTWTGYGANPQSSGGSVTSVATSSPITGGPITTSGTISLVAGALPNGMTASTNPNPADSSTNVANDAFVQNAIDLSMATTPLSNVTGGTYSFASAGSGALVSFAVTNGAISSITTWIPFVGSGYAAGDILTPQGGNYDAMIVVTGVSSGVPNAGTILYGGTGYSAGTSVALGSGNSVPFTFLLSGVLTSQANFIMPHGTYLTQSNQWIIANNTTGAFATVFCVAGATDACAAGGRTVTVPHGTNNSRSMLIQTDGVLNVDVAGIVNAADLTGTVPVGSIPTGIPIASVGSAGLSATSPVAIASTGVISLNTVPVASGGTNATTAQAAAFSLGVPYPICKWNTSSGNTADTNIDLLGQCTIPAGTMGANSRLAVDAEFETAGGGTTCKYALYFSNSATISTGVLVVGPNTAAAGERTVIGQMWVSNQNSTSAQFGSGTIYNSTSVLTTGDNGGSSTAYTTASVPVYVSLTGQASAASANICNLQHGMVLLIP